MPVIARDAVAADHLVYAWPFPIGPEEHEVACAEDELVVMCPSWMVGDRLGPGRHRWRSPDPMHPVSAYFVLTAPVDVSYDMITQFMIPANAQPVRLRANGSLQVRCTDPALLVAQFVALPFDSVNDGILRSVSRSVERMLARLLTRRVVMAGTPNAVTDPQMLGNIVEELIAYNPAAGAVFGIELVRLGHLGIYADDGSRPWQQLDWDNQPRAPANGDTLRRPEPSLLDTVRTPVVPPPKNQDLLETVRGPRPTAAAAPPPASPRAQTSPGGPSTTQASGEIVVKSKEKKTTAPGHAAAPPVVADAVPRPLAPSEETPPPLRVITTPVPAPAPPRVAAALPVPAAETDDDEVTKPEHDAQPTTETPGAASIIGIGVSHVGERVGGERVGNPSSTASGEITKKIAPGGRVLVPGPNGLMQSATVRQLLQGYYELEVGGSGETIWVPISNVVPEQ